MEEQQSSSPSSSSKPYYAVTSRDGSPTTRNSGSSSGINASTTAGPGQTNASSLLPVVQGEEADVDTVATRQWAIWLFSITTALLFADQNLMSPNLTAIAEEFGFDDEERDTKLGGHISFAFWLLGAPASLVIGILADRSNRSVLFAWTVGIGEGACLLTFWTTTYWELFLCRAATGLSIGGALPLIYSVLGDMFTAGERHKVNAFVALGSGAGISLGQGIAGFLGPTFGWRLPFLVVSVPALVCAVVVLLTVKDPARGGFEQAFLERKMAVNSANAIDSSNQAPQNDVEMQQLNPNHDTNDANMNQRRPPGLPTIGVRRRSRSLERTSTRSLQEDDYFEEGSLRTVKKSSARTFVEAHIEPTFRSMASLLKTPTVVFALLQGAPGCLPWGIVNTYLNDFLAEDRGMSVEFATFTVLGFGAGNFLGLMIGGAGGQYLYRVDKRFPALLAGSMAIFGCVPFWVLLNGVNNNSPFIFIAAVALVAGAASGVTGPIIKATLQNVTLPNMRGQAFALYNTFDDFGRGLGPVFVASMIRSLGGRTPAFNLGTLGWALCGVLNLAVFFTVEGDERRGQATLSATLNQQEHSDILC